MRDTGKRERFERATGFPIVSVLALAAACAPATPPPAPAPVVVDSAAERPAPAWPSPDPAAGLEPAPAVRPLAPWIPPALAWRPLAPSEGTAVAIHLRRPIAGREPLFVDADLAGVPVHLTRTENGWFGLGALPIGSSGRQVLSVRFGVASDSVEERRIPLEVASVEWPSTRFGIRSRTADPSPEIQARLQRERERIRSTLQIVTREWLAGGGFDWPRRDRITSPFGQRRLFAGEVRSLHLGLDVAGATGAAVGAAATGRVALVGSFLLQGNAVYVDHGLGVYSGYFHLSRIEVEEGDWVDRGQGIGRVGATGRVTGPHLHWSFYVSGQSLDPRSVLELELDEASVLESGGDAGETGG